MRVDRLMWGNGRLLALLALSSLAGGSSVVMIRVGVGEIPPTLLVTLRLSVATVAFAVTLWRLGKPLPRKAGTWRDIAIVAITNVALPMLAFTSALQHVSSAVATVFNALIPLLTGLMTHVWLRSERLSPVRWLGLGVAFAGVAYIAATRTTGTAAPAGGSAQASSYWLLVGCAAAVALTSVFTRLRLSGEDVWVVTALQTVVGLAIVAALVLLTTRPDLASISWRGWLAVIYVGLMSSYLNFLLFFHVVKRFGALPATLPWYTMPVVAGALGAWLLGEVISAPLVVGAGLILLGVAIASRVPLPAAAGGMD
jgi:drug/metabolite transporter (DMT)-like permease